jgi:hypothetical protein
MARFALALLLALGLSLPAAAQSGVPVKPITATAADSLLAKATPGAALSVYATNMTSTAAYLIGYNAVAVPSAGSLTAGLVIDCVPLPASGNVSINDQPSPPTAYSVGIVYLITSATGASACTTYTVGTVTAFIRAKVQ